MNIKTDRIDLADICIAVTYKDIKNIHLSVHPPTGRVTISAPKGAPPDIIRLFAISKLGWIRRHQRIFREQERLLPGEFRNRESHYYRGKRYLLKVVEQKGPPKVVLQHSHIELYLRPRTSKAKKEAVLEKWYREQLRKVLPGLIEMWAGKLNVQVREFGIKKMKTRWGTCNTRAKRIWLNLELAKKPPQCLEYVVVHEMVHLLERGHNERFVAYLDKFIPHWRSYRDQLNRFPFSHAEWEY